jgi:hypothetical protein
MKEASHSWLLNDLAEDKLHRTVPEVEFAWLSVGDITL